MNGLSRDTFGIKFFLKDHKVDFPVLLFCVGSQESVIPAVFRCLGRRVSLSMGSTALYSWWTWNQYYLLEAKTLLAHESHFWETIWYGFRYSQESQKLTFSGILSCIYRHLWLNTMNNTPFRNEEYLSARRMPSSVKGLFMFSRSKLHNLIQNCSPCGIFVNMSRTYSMLAASLENAVHNSSLELKYSVDRPEIGNLQLLDLWLKHPVCAGNIASQMQNHSCHYIVGTLNTQRLALFAIKSVVLWKSHVLHLIGSVL